MRRSKLFTAIGIRAAGEPGRVITGGVLEVPGWSVFESRLYFERRLDGLRK